MTHIGDRNDRGVEWGRVGEGGGGWVAPWENDHLLSIAAILRLLAQSVRFNAGVDLIVDIAD